MDEHRRNYYFIERDLGDEAKATIAVRIVPEGKDLLVEWQHYVRPPYEAGLWTFLSSGAAYNLVPAIKKWVREHDRAQRLKGFQEQDSTTLQMTVRAALEEAIDLAGISKSLIQQLSTESGKERRII